MNANGAGPGQAIVAACKRELHHGLDSIQRAGGDGVPYEYYACSISGEERRRRIVKLECAYIVRMTITPKEQVEALEVIHVNVADFVSSGDKLEVWGVGCSRDARVVSILNATQDVDLNLARGGMGDTDSSIVAGRDEALSVERRNKCLAFYAFRRSAEAHRAPRAVNER
jgi:hypothetical protein